VSKKKTLRKIVVPKRVKERGYWRGLRNEELHDLYSSPRITGVLKLGTTKLVGRVARMRKKERCKRGFVCEI
jgi:hypothetical protein